jgi:HAE1 family hydrophobic/amphiphilic exporter-1
VPKDFRDLQGFLSYSVAGGLSNTELGRYINEIIVPLLESVKGVADVKVYGIEETLILIDVDRSKALSLGVKTEEIAEGLRTYGFKKNVGTIDGQNSRATISVCDRVENIEEIRKAIISKDGDGRIVRLGDVAVVHQGVSEPTGYYRINGKPSVTIILDKESNVNTLRLADEVYRKLGIVEKQLPSGIRIYKETDKSDEMRKELSRFYSGIAASLICIFIIVALFLRNIKASILVLSTVLFSVAGALCLFWICGIGLNLLTLAGLVVGFGRLVDDSIVVLDNIHRHVDCHPLDRMRGISGGVAEIATPVIASTLTTIGALLPFAFLPQELKVYFLQFGVAVGISLTISLFVSFSLIPIAASRLILTP